MPLIPVVYIARGRQRHVDIFELEGSNGVRGCAVREHDRKLEAHSLIIVSFERYDTRVLDVPTCVKTAVTAILVDLGSVCFAAEHRFVKLFLTRRRRSMICDFPYIRARLCRLPNDTQS